MYGLHATGHIEDDRPPSHGELRDLAERKALTRLCGPTWGLLRAVVA